MILDKTSAIAWVASRFPTYRTRRGEELTMPSPFPKLGTNAPPNQSKHQIWLNIEKDMWKCWASGRHGRFFQLVCDVDGCDKREAIEKYYERNHAGDGWSDLDQRTSEKTVFSRPSLPAGAVSIRSSSSRQAVMAASYLSKRGLAPREVMDVYVVDSPSSKYYGYAIFPFYDRAGGLIYWQGRDFTGTKQDKYVAPPKHIAERKDVIYCLDWDFAGHVVFVVEGLFDVIGLSYLGLHGIAVLGSEISRSQIRLLTSHGASEIAIATDIDAVGERTATDMMSSLATCDCAVRRAAPPNGKDFWDYYASNSSNVAAARTAIMSNIKDFSYLSALTERLIRTIDFGHEEPHPMEKNVVPSDDDLMARIKSLGSA